MIENVKPGYVKLYWVCIDQLELDGYFKLRLYQICLSYI